jgi:hypothetical protein
VSDPRLPPEWDEWGAHARLAHLTATRSRADLGRAILATLGLAEREWTGQLRQAELAAILVALLEATGADPSSVIFDARTSVVDGGDRGDRP